MRGSACLALVVILAPVSLAAGAPRKTSLLTFDAEAAKKNRPVSKVITLLKDMLKQLEKEAEEDEEIYDKMSCWCETNDKEKTKAVADAEAKISDLTSKIEEWTAMTSRLSAEIKNLEKEVAENQDALDKATALRQKELAEFNSEEKDLLESISALKAAITVLSKHHSDALLQGSRAQISNIALTVKYQLERHANLLKGVLTPTQRRAMNAFFQAPEDYMNKALSLALTGQQSDEQYSPQGGEIFGILKQMLETFETNLTDAQKQEISNQKAYSGLKAAKEDEISAGQAQLTSKTEELASTEMKNAQAKEDIEDTKASLSEDQQFLLMLKEKCSMTDKEWEQRQKTRQEETEAVSKALAVLSGDDAHDLFSKTFNPALVQTHAVIHSDRRDKAVQLLKKVAQRISPEMRARMSALAAQAQLDAFARVKQAIDDMVAELQKEKQDEIKQKDFCVDEFNTNELQTEKKKREETELAGKIEDLEMQIDEAGKAVAGLEAEIEEMQVQLKRAGEDREKQNHEFQQVVADQRETQKLLQQAVVVLEEFYGKKAPQDMSMAQQHSHKQAPPPPGFQSYKKSGAAGGVLGLIKQIISDAKSMEAETIQAENDAQTGYEDFVKETNSGVESKKTEIVNKSKIKATAEGDLVTAKEGKDSVTLELEQLSNYEAGLHQSCDFLVKNFDVRQTARDEEIDALRQAKAILSGAKFDDFLQA